MQSQLPASFTPYQGHAAEPSCAAADVVEHDVRKICTAIGYGAAVVTTWNMVTALLDSSWTSENRKKTTVDILSPWAER